MKYTKKIKVKLLNVVDPLKLKCAKNINFSLDLSKNDKRSKVYESQRIQRGFDDTETWNLQVTIAKFILPRLIRFKEVNCGHPMGLTDIEYDAILDEMIAGFSIVCSDEYYNFKPDDIAKTKRAVDLFAEYFQNLWW